MKDWVIDRPTGHCVITGRPFEEDEEYHAVLFEQGESFRREDYSLQAWKGPPEGCFCHYKTRVPKKQKRKKLFVDDQALIVFFDRLENETEPLRVRFRFVLALILMRKRLLRYVGAETVEGHEVWEMILTPTNTPRRVVNPDLTEDQVIEVSQELSTILHGDAVSLLEAMEAQQNIEDAQSPDLKTESPDEPKPVSTTNEPPPDAASKNTDAASKNTDAASKNPDAASENPDAASENPTSKD